MNNENIDIFAPGFTIEHEIQFFNLSITEMVWSPNGKKLAVNESYGGSYFLWDSSNNTIEKRSVNAAVKKVFWSPDDKMMAIVTIDGIQIHNLAEKSSWRNSNLIISKLDMWTESDGLKGRVQDVLWLRDGARLILLDRAGQLMLWNIKDNKVVLLKNIEDSTPLLLSTDPNQTTIAMSSPRKDISLFHFNTGKTEELEKAPHLGFYKTLCWSPNGQFLAAGNFDGKIHIWDMKSKQLMMKLNECKGSVESVSFSNDGRLLASSSTDNVIRVWRIKDWNLVAQIPEFSGGVKCGVIFHPNKNILATGYNACQKIRLWEYEYWVSR